MNGIQQLKAQAAALRDARISQARIEYRKAIASIEDIERQLEGKNIYKAQRKTKLAEKILEVIPQDREFTVDDVTLWLQTAYPRLDVTVPTVRTTLNRMANDERIVQTQRGVSNKKAIFHAQQHLPQAEPFGPDTQLRVIMEILRDAGKPLSGVEIVVQLQERGMRVDDPEKKLKSVGSAMRKRNDVFRGLGDGMWEMRTC